jgi:hypothetical protein
VTRGAQERGMEQKGAQQERGLQNQKGAQEERGTKLDLVDQLFNSSGLVLLLRISPRLVLLLRDLSMRLFSFIDQSGL